MPDKDVYGKALWDYYKGKDAEGLVIHTSYGDIEDMPVEVFYRDFDDFPMMEAFAIERCRGKILDVGAGVGCHSLIMQDQGKDVHPIDISDYCVKIMNARAIENVRKQDFFKLKGEQYDTILFLMNGIGIAGDVNGLKKLLNHCKSLLKEGGEIVFDSSDVQYLKDYDGVSSDDKYIGEIAYQYEYHNNKGDWFNWLYIDPELMKKVAGDLGWKFELLHQDENDQYLASLTR
ncbi:MAG: SAM-dependent methyltransferase [Thalassobius sp.]|nr:SAM-dependent methyltransferase [Thalassovita sp.]